MKWRKWLGLLIMSICLHTVYVQAAEEEEIWKPEEPFFIEHEAECVKENRQYRTNGPNGNVVFYESPASSKVVNTLENGEIVLVDYVFTNDKGISWGLCEIEGKFGWLPMPYMVTVYDYLNFEEEYGAQFQNIKGDITDGKPGLDDDERLEFSFEFYDCNHRVKFWSYPGSSRKFTMALAKGTSNMPNYSKIFVDEDGRTWGFVEYFSGKHVNSWVCLDSVEKMLADFDELYPEGTRNRDKRVIVPYEGEEIFPDDYEQMQRMQKVKKTVMIMGIAVVVLIVVFHYWKLWKKIKQA